MAKYTIKDVEVMLGVSRHLIYRLIESGELKCNRSGKNERFITFSQKQINDYLKGVKK